MGRFVRVSVGWTMFAMVMVGCGPAPTGSGVTSQASSNSGQQRAPIRLVAGIRGTPPFLYNKLNPLNINPGVQSLERLVNAGLANVDNQSVLHSELAEAAPSLKAGSWKLLPDGRMETIWKLKPDAKWQD